MKRLSIQLLNVTRLHQLSPLPLVPRWALSQSKADRPNFPPDGKRAASVEQSSRFPRWFVEHWTLEGAPKFRSWHAGLGGGGGGLPCVGIQLHPTWEPPRQVPRLDDGFATTPSQPAKLHGPKGPQNPWVEALGTQLQPTWDPPRHLPKFVPLTTMPLQAAKLQGANGPQ